MKTLVYCEAARPHALGLIAKAREFSTEVTALCEQEDSCAACLHAGASSAFVLPLHEDDCAQGDCIASAIRQIGADSVLFPATVRGRFLSAWDRCAA